ncbi:MAG: methylmalonyl Co-A mutase-associated GTPase MeaB [Anaerolineaceae bacterium]|nr:methylmalonyl Co-A mutase-associated GTPase MeaB [Anaerolineaceae bacterium]
MELVERVLAGERLALARLLTQVENNTPTGREALERLFPLTGRAHLVGITGAPGTGKSSLANRLALGMRKEGAPKVGVVAVDPTSPFSGGALLGDRLRMKDVAGDSGVFIRSMAARGTLGGLARATAAVVQVLDAAGYDPVLIETVGAGQSEVDIVRLAHTVLVVDAPGLGDDIQAIKAGILEIADLLVVNKADQPGVENTLRALQAMLDIGEQRYAQAGWKPPLLRASAVTGEGIAEILAAIRAHGEYLGESGGRRQRDETRLTREFEALLQEELLARWRAGTEPETVAAVLARLKARKISPGGAVRELLG